MPEDLRLERWLLVSRDLPRGAVMELTGEQLRAVERREGSLFLSAGAGSGKTRVLVERFVRAAIEDDVPVDRILAITFTERAAGELKTRIRARFTELGERDRAREAEAAWISTIHAFCARLLRAHPLEAGVDPEFRVLDEHAAGLLAVTAFDRALEQFLADRSAAERLDLVASYTPDKLERMVRAVHSRLRTRGQRKPELPPIDPPQADASAMRRTLEAAISSAGSALRDAGDGLAVTRALATIEALADALSRVPSGGFGDPDDFATLTLKRGNAKALRCGELDALEGGLAAWRSACASAKAYGDYLLLARLLDVYARHYERMKLERSALDFDDLELGTRDVLVAEPTLRASVAGRFDHVMVDEYQDTNPLQNELLDLIARDRLFAVGDELQSIYGFRGADVEGFRHRADEQLARGRAERLATTFRMGPQLAVAINAAFAPVFGERYAPIASAGQQGSEPIELLVVDRSSSRWNEALGEGAFGTALEDVSAWRAAEARLVAARIDALLGVYPAGDIALLVRAATDLRGYEAALAERGVPTYASGSAGYWHRQEIGDLRAYLAALANPCDELSLDCVLASPLVGVKLDTLARLHRRAHGARRDLWWALEEAFGEGGDGSDGLATELEPAERERLRTFVRRFAAERRGAAGFSLATLIERAVSQSGYDVAVLTRRDGARRMANVRKLMRLAREFEAESGRDLRGLIDYVDEHELVVAREPEAALEAEGLDAVRLMTIHAAKGLEFPVVVVADLGREAARDDSPLQISADGRVGLEVASLTGSRDAGLELDQIKEDEKRERDAEERRILYVAMTRAKERLVLSGAADLERFPEPKPLGPPIDWLHRALAPEMRGAGSGADGTLGTRWLAVSPSNVDEALPAADRTPRRPRPRASAEAEFAPAAPDMAPPAFFAPAVTQAKLVTRLSYSALESYKRCAYRFYLERVVGMRALEPIRRAQAADPQAADPQAQLPLAAQAEPALSPLARGTIIHELLERVDFRRPRVPDVAGVHARAAAIGVTPSDAEADEMISMVAGLLGSPLATRLAGAPRIRRELPFAFGMDSLLINGVFDVYAEEPRGVLVVDYKSDPVEADLAELCEARYETQRRVYALAALRSGAERVEIAYAFLERPEEPVVASYGDADGAQLEDALRTATRGLLAGAFEPTDHPHRGLCSGCPGQPALCKWGPDRTLADEPPGDPAIAFPSAAQRTLGSP